MNEDEMKALFLLARLDIANFFKLENEYWPDCENYADIRRNSPWWLVKTPFGLIKLGWRKRVIEIDWSDTPYRSGESKFADGRDIAVLSGDQVTKDETYIHAWSYAKAVEYLSNLHLRPDQVVYAAENPELDGLGVIVGDV